MAGELYSLSGMHSVSSPAKSETLSATPNEAQERRNELVALHIVE
jgi:hypothetical protein